MLNYNLIKDEYNFLGDDIYLNIVSEGVPPISVQHVVENYMKSTYNIPKARTAKNIAPAVSKSKELFANLISGTTDEISFVKNTSEGLSIFAQGFDFKSNDNVVISMQEHPSCLYPFINGAKQKGYNLNLIPKDITELTVDTIFSYVDQDTKAIVISSAQFSNGYFADLKAIGAECKKRGIIFVVDGIQSMGRQKIDVIEQNIDFLSTGGHKGLLSLAGLGFVYCNKAIQNRVTPPYMAMCSVTEHYPEISWVENGKKFEYGNQSNIALETMAKSLELITSLGIENIDSHIKNLDEKLRELTKPYESYIITPTTDGLSSGIVCYDVSSIEQTKVLEILAKYNIIASIKNNALRFGFDFFNVISDVENAKNAIAKIFG